MDHVAIMRKSWGLTQKILTGEKKIESRWYRMKRTPFDTIAKKDTVYFKDSGEPVSMKASVSNVMQFSLLTPEKVKQILKKYGKDDGIGKEQIEEYYARFQDKKYCILIFLENVEKIKPFHIDKTGFGVLSAWISIDDIRNIRQE